MKKYETYSHAKTKLRYHLIFSTKYRRKFLNDIRDSVLSAFNYAESISQFKILIMEVDKDHIHILITFKPNISISQVVRRLKQITTICLWENNEQFLKKFYWKNKKILWTGGYFASTIGEVSEETLKHYIENQG